MNLTRIMLALSPLVLASPALAQGTPEQRAACGPDAFRLCSAAIPNVGKIAACLRQERARLSTACRTVLDAQDAPKEKVAAAPPSETPKVAARKVAAKTQPAPRAAGARNTTPPARTRLAQRAAPTPQPAARQRVVERSSVVSGSARRGGATRVITRTVYVYVPAKRASVRRVASRPYYGRRGSGGSEMAQAIYWMQTVSSYANAIGDGSALGGFGGLGGLTQ